MNLQVEKTLYDVLDVSANASFDDVERAFERIKIYFDNVSLVTYSMLDEDERERHRKELAQAYRVLSDPDRRAAYDRALSAGDIEPADFAVKTPQRQKLKIPETPKDIRVVSEYVPKAKTRGPERSNLTANDLPEHLRKFLPGQENEVASGEVPEEVASAPVIEQPLKGPKGKLVVPEGFEVSAETKFDGAFLKGARESCQATLEDVAEITKIGKHYLRAIEENDFERLPAPVYVRGFVAEYARILSLSPEDVSKHYMELFRAHRS